MNKQEKKLVRNRLEKALELINEPENWIKGAMARNNRRRSVIISDPGASRFCAAGAVRRACFLAGDQPHKYGCYGAVAHLERFVPKKFPGILVTTFNDDKKTTHLMVKRMFQRAIKDLET